MTALAEPRLRHAHRGRRRGEAPGALGAGGTRHPVLLVGAAAVGAAGVVVMVAWYVDALWLLRANGRSTPIVFNTGLACALSGAGLGALLLGRRRWVVATSALTAVVAGLSLVEQVADRSLGLDQLFVDTTVAVPPAVPGRMALNTAVCFLLLAAVLLTRIAISGRLATVATIVGGGAVIAISGAAGAGYALQQEGAYQWGRFTPMALPTAVLFCLAGAELLALAWADASPVAPVGAQGSAVGGQGFSTWSLRRVVTVLAIVAYLPLVSMAVFGVTIASRAVTAEAEGRLQAAATLEARAVEARLEGVQAASRSMAALPTLVANAAGGPGFDSAAVQRVLDDGVRLQPGVPSIGLTDAAGTLVAVSPPTPEAIGESFSFRDWYRGVKASGEVYVSEAVQSAATGHPYVVAVAAPIRSSAEGAVVGYLSVGYELAAVQDFVTGFELDQNVDLVVTDQRGIVVAAPDPPEGLEPLDDAAVRAALGGATGTRTQDSPEGDQLVGYAPVGDLGWTSTARVEKAVALERVGTLRAAATAVALVIAAALTMVLVLVARTWRARAEAEAALDAAIVELNRSNDELEQFAYAASHDLSEPLRAISGPISLVARRYRGQLDPESDQFIDFAVDGCARMQQLIDGLLAYSRVGRVESPMGTVDCEVVMEGVIDGLGPAIVTAGATIDVGPLPTVQGEASQLGQVLGNLLANAIKFARPDVPPTITVAATRDGAVWRFTITDDGIGIDPEHRDRVWGMFKRLHARDTYPGTGIGLALVRKIVERHGGEVGVETAPSGTGSQFWFTVPAREERP